MYILNTPCALLFFLLFFCGNLLQPKKYLYHLLLSHVSTQEFVMAFFVVRVLTRFSGDKGEDNLIGDEGSEEKISEVARALPYSPSHIVGGLLKERSTENYQIRKLRGNLTTERDKNGSN